MEGYEKNECLVKYQKFCNLWGEVILNRRYSCSAPRPPLHYFSGLEISSSVFKSREQTGLGKWKGKKVCNALEQSFILEHLQKSVTWRREKVCMICKIISQSLHLRGSIALTRERQERTREHTAVLSGRHQCLQRDSGARWMQVCPGESAEVASGSTASPVLFSSLPDFIVNCRVWQMLHGCWSNSWLGLLR